MAEDKGTGALIFIGAPMVFLAGFFFFFIIVIVIVIVTGGGAAAACTGSARTVNPDNVPAAPVAGYSGDQLKNAAHIMNAAATLGLDRNAQVIGVMTAVGESGLAVLDNGDAVGPDSRGLFQQRDNGAWGSYENRMDPATSANNFFTALIATSGWETLEPTLAAHKVQGNADPYHYEAYFGSADQIVTALTGEGRSGTGCASGTIAFPLSAGYNMTDDYGPRPQPGAGASTWHPATDSQHYPGPCADPIYAAAAGTVTLSTSGQISVKSPDGYTVSYLHMKASSAIVTVGDAVTAGQQISAVGNEMGSFGCHLDIRISKVGSTDPAVSALTAGEDLGGPASSYGYVNPEEFYALFGMELCAQDTCKRNVS